MLFFQWIKKLKRQCNSHQKANLLLLSAPFKQDKSAEPSALFMRERHANLIQDYLKNFQPLANPPLCIQLHTMANLPIEKKLGKAGIIIFHAQQIEYYPYSMSYIDNTSKKQDVFYLLDTYCLFEDISLSGSHQPLVEIAKKHLSYRNENVHAHSQRIGGYVNYYKT